MRDFSDKAFRDRLLIPDNLRDLIKARVPELADSFDFERVRLVQNQYLLPDGRGREADLIFEIPYRLGDEEKIALVCVLIEHQTRPDPRMALRTLLYVVLYWEKKWSEWEELPPPKREFRLPPVLPIVFHTGTQPWGSARSIAEMLDEPKAFHQFAPVWSPLFWELSKQSVDELLTADEALLQVLAVLRVEDAELAQFAQVLHDAAKRRLSDGSDGKTGRIVRPDLLYLIIGLITHRRPAEEHAGLLQIIENLVANNPVQREEIKTMVESYADVLVAEGERKGKIEGKAEGTREIVVRLGSKHLGPTDADTIVALNSIKDIGRLQRMADRADEASSWVDLLSTP